MANSFVPGLTAIGGDRSYQFGPERYRRPHVFVVNGTYLAPLGMRVGAILFARSGFPYTGVVGIDANGDGFTSSGSFGDRPASPHAQLVPLSRADHARHQPGVRLEANGLAALELRFDVFNLGNKRNITTVNNIIGLDPNSPPATFGTVTAVGPQRQAQIAVRYRF